MHTFSRRKEAGTSKDIEKALPQTWEGNNIVTEAMVRNI